MRRLLLIALPIAALGCYHDNASPFVHGAKNAPSRGGSTHVSARSATPPATDTTGTTYGASSGYAGAIDKSGAKPAGGSTATSK